MQAQEVEITKKTLDVQGYTHISVSVDTANNRLTKIRSGEIRPLVTSSKKETDKIGGFFPTDQIVIAARTGMGKSSFVLSWIKDFVDLKLNPTYKDNLLILFDSWEMPDWKNVLRMYSRMNQITVNTLLDYYKTMQEDAFQRILLLSNQLRDYPIYFRNISQTSNHWLETKRQIQKANPKMKIVNIVDHTRLLSKDNERSEEELISGFMIKGMKLKLEEEQINIFLSQMNRSIETSGKREDIGRNLPVSSDIFGADFQKKIQKCHNLLEIFIYIYLWILQVLRFKRLTRLITMNIFFLKRNFLILT